MKKLFLLLTILLFAVTSCTKEESPVLSISQTSVSAPAEGNKTTITLSANNFWSVSGTDWCAVSPSSGMGGEMAVTITVNGNGTYDARNCTLTFTSAGLTQTLNVSQESNYGLILSKNTYEISSDAQQISVEVKANINYDVTINADWIKQNGTKALTSKTYNFDVEGNDTYDTREGTIIIKGQNLVDTIKVKQVQKDAIIISSKEYNLTSEAQSLEVKVQTNVELDVIIPDNVKDWISHTATKALSDKNIILDIKANNTYDAREGTIIIKGQNLVDTIKVKQVQKDVILLSTKEYNLTGEAQSIELKLQTNIAFDVIIPDNVKDWISHTATKALSESNVILDIKANEGEARTADVIFQKHDSSIREIVRIIQYSNQIPTNEIWYTSSDNNIINPNKAGEIIFGATICSNEYKNGIGKIIFDGPVTKVGTQAFYNCDLIKSVLLPETVKTIGYKAFSTCSNLQSINIPEGVTRIEEEAVSFCSKLKSVNFPNSITYIGKQAFHMAYELATVTLPDNLNCIGDRAFYDCDKLTSINIPESLTTLEGNPFSGCDLVKFSGKYASADGKYLIKDGEVRSFCPGTNEDIEYTIPNEVTTIGNRAFCGYSQLKDVKIHDKVTTIGEYSFQHCGMKAIIIPKSVTSIGYGAFMYADLEDIYFYPTVPPSLGVNAFYMCNGGLGYTIHVRKGYKDTYKAAGYKGGIVDDIEE